MRYLACILGGFILGSSVLWAQPDMLDYGTLKPEDRGKVFQWQLENEIRKGNNPYAARPCQ